MDRKAFLKDLERRELETFGCVLKVKEFPGLKESRERDVTDLKLSLNRLGRHPINSMSETHIKAMAWAIALFIAFCVIAGTAATSTFLAEITTR